MPLFNNSSNSHAEEESDDDSSSLTSEPRLPSYVQSTTVAGGPSATSSTYAMFSMHPMSSVHFVQFPETIYAPDKIGQVLATSWPNGVKKHGWYHGAYEYKFQGKPWGHRDDGRGVASRRLMCAMLDYLYREGWILQTAFTASHWRRGLDTLLFRKVESASLPEVDWLVLILSGRDRIRVLADANKQNTGVTDNGKGPASSSSELLDALRVALTQSDFLEDTEENHGTTQFNLKGSPFWGMRKSTVTQRVIILRTLEVLERFGWRVYGTMRQRTQVKDEHKLDTWYLVRSTDWVSGSPFNGEPSGTAHGFL